MMAKRGNPDCETCSADTDYDGEPLELTPCPSCGAEICNECTDAKGRCGDCGTYDLPGNFKILTYTKGLEASKHIPKGGTLAEVRILQFTGAGLGHFHIDIIELLPSVSMDETQKRIRVNKGTIKEDVSALVRDALVEEYGEKEVYIKFYSDFGRQWFYREGD